MNVKSGLDIRTTVGFGADAIAEALSGGAARCVSTTHPVPTMWDKDFDSHLHNVWQIELYQDLFNELDLLMQTLEATPGRVSASLADETVVVVYSELNRGPGLNDNGGKDHWPYGSAMVIGPGVQGTRSVGGYDDLVFGRAVDPQTGDLHEGGQTVSSEALGATLLALGDVDPGEYVGSVEPITGVLA